MTSRRNGNDHDEAEAYARDFFAGRAHWIAGRNRYSADGEFLDVLLADGAMRPELRGDAENPDVAKIVERARAGGIYAKLACFEAAKWYLSSGKPIPQPLAVLICDHLETGAAVLRQKDGKEPLRDIYRKAEVITLIEDLRDGFGLSPTRNAAKTAAPSACAIVAKVVCECGWHVTEDGIQKIWQRNR